MDRWVLNCWMKAEFSSCLWKALIPGSCGKAVRQKNLMWAASLPLVLTNVLSWGYDTACSTKASLTFSCWWFSTAGTWQWAVWSLSQQGIDEHYVCFLLVPDTICVYFDCGGLVSTHGFIPMWCKISFQGLNLLRALSSVFAGCSSGACFDVDLSKSLWTSYGLQQRLAFTNWVLLFDWFSFFFHCICHSCQPLEE